MALPLQDRSSILFGRETDIAFLQQRATERGVTVVVGRAQMGKSWLLTETARRLVAASPHFLVGLTECTGESSDLVLRAIANLYTRWLSDSTWSAQAQLIWNQQNNDIYGKVGEAVGSIFKSLSKVAGPGEAVGSLVEKTMKSLAAANRDLVSGGISVPRLQSEQAANVLRLVSGISRSRLVLVLDQWDKSPGMEAEMNILDSFTKHIDEWPDCHIFIGTRPDDKPLQLFQELRESSLGSVELFDLPALHLEDGQARAPLLNYLRSKLPAVTDVADAELIDLISGYPGTIGRWTNPYGGKKISSLDDLREGAADAQAFLYRDLNKKLSEISDLERVAAIRLSLIPSTADKEQWRLLKPVLMEGIKPSVLDDLRRTRVLESGVPPSYGHAKRCQAALNWLAENRTEEYTVELQGLVSKCAGYVIDTEESAVAFASVLAGFLAISTGLLLSDEEIVLCQCAASLFGNCEVLSTRVLCSVAKRTVDRGGGSASVPLLCMGLINALIDRHDKGMVEDVDEIFSRILDLFTLFPENPAVRSRFAIALFDMIVFTTEWEDYKRREAALDKFREINAIYPDDSAWRLFFSKSLANVVASAKREGSENRRDLLLDELRQLAARHPDDTPLQEEFGRALVNVTIDYNHDRAQFSKQNHLLEELTIVTERTPKRTSLLHKLAERLRFGTDALFITDEESNLWIAKLRNLADDYPEDIFIQEQLGEALWSAIVSADREADPQRGGLILKYARSAQQQFPLGERLRDTLAMCLRFTRENLTNRREQAVLMEELRSLLTRYPDDDAVKLQVSLAENERFAPDDN